MNITTHFRYVEKRQFSIFLALDTNYDVFANDFATWLYLNKNHLRFSWSNILAKAVRKSFQFDRNWLRLKLSLHFSQ